MCIAASGLAAFPVTAAEAAATTCGGLIFQDFDADGERVEDYSYVSSQYAAVPDAGVDGLTVTVTDAQGDVFIDTTDSQGVWSVDLDTADFPIRVDITGYPSTWSPGPVGPDSATLNQYIVDPAECTGPFDGIGPVGNASITAPGSFCENRPEFVTSCFLFGNVASHDDEAAVVSVIDGAADNGATTGTNWQDDPYTVLATLGDVGTIYGLDTRPQDQSTYVASFVKRHTRLGPTGNPTTIYRIDGSGPAPWFTVDPSATDPHSGAVDGWLNDFDAFDAVGKTGLGDLEISPDGNTLFTIDLANRQLIEVPINADGSPDTGAVTRTLITAAALGVGCADDDVRPFGLGFDENGSLLVGVVCSGQSTVAADSLPVDATTGDPLISGAPSPFATRPEGWVFSYNGSFSRLVDVPLPDTTRGTQNGQTTGPNAFRGQTDWRPWVSEAPFDVDFAGWPTGAATWAQPIISDIEADGDDLVIGVMDRWAHQTGSNAFYRTDAGDIRQIAQPISSSDTLRAVASSSGYTVPTNGTDFFYDGDDYLSTHSETTLGSAGQIPGRPYTVTNSFDPIELPATWQSGGLEWFDNSGLGTLTAGQHVRGYRLYDGNDGVFGDGSSATVGTFEKAAGIGDLQARCGEAPIQVGNRIWHDANNDGIADPGETPLAGILVELVDANGNVVDSVATNAAGEYLFDELVNGAAYTIRVAASNLTTGGPLASGGTYEGLTLPALANIGNDDGIDSDAVLVGGLPSIEFTASETDHTLDIGLIDSLSLGNTVWLDQDGDGTQNGAEPGIAGVEVQLWSVDANGAPLAMLATDTTDTDGQYRFDDLAPGDYIVAIADTQAASSAPLDGLFSTAGNGAAPDPDDDVDNDDNGDPAPGFASISTPITLATGTEPATNHNPTVDFGFTATAGLGDLVFLDEDRDGQRDPGEPGVPGVTVMVIDEDTGGVVATVVTDANGNYLVTGLTPGRYRVTFDDPQGRRFTATDNGDDASDSDASSSGTTGVVELSAGELDLTIDAGLIVDEPTVPPTVPTNTPPATVPPNTPPATDPPVVDTPPTTAGSTSSRTVTTSETVTTSVTSTPPGDDPDQPVSVDGADSEREVPALALTGTNLTIVSTGAALILLAAGMLLTVVSRRRKQSVA